MWTLLSLVYARRTVSDERTRAQGDAENLSKNTVCNAIHKVELLDVVVMFPGHLPTQSIKEIAGFPRVIGALDCTHIPISACQAENEVDYVNRKSFYSPNVQGCSVECRWVTGSTPASPF
ncbi:putative nuclease HARBI1 isoform X2 [Thunnus albacares]|uniref:putative nuclease HARBI1 isoform X2 n=1 Tax=Thunnus albacares TaxID=8236 RepID=UPI001CF61DD2|nr:putative nuclease HARBI1 isoform X2 [Thunnus albacares]